MFDGLIDTVLANVLAWEYETISIGGVKRNRIVAPVDLVQSELFEVSDESSEEMSLWHGETRIGVVFSELVHHEHGQVLVADVKDEIWSSLINFLRNITLLHDIENVVTVSHEMPVNEIEWIPLPVNFSALGLRLPIGVELFIHEIVDVEVKILVETFFGHVLSSISEEANIIFAIHFLDGPDDL